MTEAVQRNTIRSVSLRGMSLLNNPALNKGTAFTEDEREAFGLHGLLPPDVETLDQQSKRAYEAFLRKPDDLERHIYLRAAGHQRGPLLPPAARPHRRDDAGRLYARRGPRLPAVQPHLSPPPRPLHLLPAAADRSRHCCATTQMRKWTSSSSPTGSASLASAIKASAGSASRSASYRSIH